MRRLTFPSRLELRAILQHELDYRRERRLSIMTWANTILVAITGGVIGLELNSGNVLSGGQRLVMTVGVIILVAFASLWWRSHRYLELLLKERLSKYDSEFGIELGDTKREAGLLHVRGVASTILLGLAAVAAVWVSRI